MFSFIMLLSLAPLFYIVSSLYGLYKNYLLARQTGLRIVFAPLRPDSNSWRLLSPLLAPILKQLRWCRIIDANWSWEDDARQQVHLGENFMVVTPGVNILHISDKAAVEHVLAKRKDFIKPPIYKVLDLFGENVDTVNGEDWARHRKITAPCFNERVSSFVWDESIRQARSMLTHWLSQPKGKISRMVDDTRILALHVLFAAGFGVSHDFLRGARYPAPGHQLSHCDALMTILYNLVTSIIISSKAAFFENMQVVLGTRVRHILLAVKEFRQYMEEAIASEREVLSTGQGTSKPNLISTLIRTSDQAKAEGVQAAVQLTDDEIKGNIFIFNLAGHDTTANTLAYAFALLSMHREIQDWVVEEVDEVTKDDVNPSYEEAYPRLKRVQAVMYETLRLYGPAPQFPRGVLAANTLLQVTNLDPTSSSPTTTMLVPSNTEITLRLHAMHTNPANFPNPRVWDPKRWISSSSGSTSSSSILNNEHLIQPGPSFAPWSSGPRICPGMKFAQVEFAAVLSTVLRRASVAPSVRGDFNVSEDVARKKVKELIRDSHIGGPTLTMRRPEEVCIKVSAR